MNYKHIEASREVRLWITQIILPVAVACVVLLPDVRQTVMEKANAIFFPNKNWS
jgi:hypothetical protein